MSDIAAGFIGLKDVFAKRVSQVGVDIIREAIDLSTSAYNQALDRMLAVLVSEQDPLKPQERYKMPATATMQPLDEYGKPKPVQGELFYTQAFPLLMAGHAWGGNWIALTKMTVQEANDHTLAALRADADWNMRHILAALFFNTAWTFQDEEHGDLTVRALALSSETDVKYATRTGSLVTFNAYRAQADAIDATHNPLPTLVRDLRQFPGNTGPILTYIHNDQRASIEALAGFVPVSDPDIEQGISTDRLRASGPSDHLGDELIGKVDGTWVAEWGRMPSGYMVSHVHGVKTLARRQQAESALRGLIRRESTDGHMTLYEFYRFAGFAPRIRNSMIVTRIGDASYAPPSGYTAMPLPI